MANVSGYRRAWIEAAEYRRQWDEYRERQGRKNRKESEDDRGGMDRTPVRDLEKETLAGVLAGEILVQNHCYRADEMLTMIDISHEFGYKITAFHHAVEAYKIADILAREGICSDIWADWWGFKMEALDGIRENAAILQKAGACVVIHSDSAEGIQRLNQEAAKAMAAGNRMGMTLRPEDAIRWITLNPAKSIGVGDQTGSLEPGKMADVVVWSGNPFSVYSRAEKVYIDGALVYDRADPARQPRTDFEVGIMPRAEGDKR
jgi:imidazolonepropionase-like amidohydrolase